MPDAGAPSIPRPGGPRSLGGLAGRELDDLRRLVDELSVDDPLKHEYLRQRWLSNVEWYHWGATSAQRRYYFLRIVTIVGGVTIPAIVSLNLGSDVADSAIQWITFAISLTVALSAALEEFFRFGDRWRHYRLAGELLKSEGWAFFQHSGVYAQRGQRQSFSLFVQRVEDTLRHEVGEYIGRIVAERPDRPGADDDTADTPS